MNDNSLRAMMTIFDFNLRLRFGHDTPRFSRKGMANERWTDHLRSIHGLPAETRIQPLRAALFRQPPNPKLLLPRPVSLHGFRTTDLSRKPAGYRNLSAGHAAQALSRRHPRQRVAEHYGRCQRNQGLAYLRRLRRGADHPSAASLCPRRVRRDPATDRLRFRLDNDRSVSVAVPLGKVPQAQGRRQAAHAARPARRNPLFCACFSRKNARRPRPRRTADRAGGLLRHGSRLYRLRSSPSVHSVSFLLPGSLPSQSRLYPPFKIG